MTTIDEDIQRLKGLEQDYQGLIDRLESKGPAGNHAEIFHLERKLCKVIAARLDLESRGLVK
jgi:hypothetical protein